MNHEELERLLSAAPSIILTHELGLIDLIQSQAEDIRKVEDIKAPQAHLAFQKDLFRSYLAIAGMVKNV